MSGHEPKARVIAGGSRALKPGWRDKRIKGAKSVFSPIFPVLSRNDERYFECHKCLQRDLSGKTRITYCFIYKK